MKALDPRVIFSTTNIYPKLFFKSRGEATIHLAFGCRERVFDLEMLSECAYGLDEKIFGGFRFDGLAPISSEWASFEKQYFFKPEIEMAFRRDEHLNEPRQNSSKQRWIVDQNSAASYQELVSGAVQKIQQGALEKVVLCSREKAEYSLDVARFLSQASMVGSHYVFCFQPDPEHAFFGVTPECLYRRSGTFLQTEALAGTKFTGSLEKFGRKERIEQEIVERFVTASALNLCDSYEVAAPTSIASGALSHLKSSVSGGLKVGVSDFDIIEKLHPTPALAGYPRRSSIDFIQTHEGFDRGFFGGGIGYFGAQGADVCVPIRSALWAKGTLYQYAGAGIVLESNPVDEWHEIQAKFQALRQYL